MYMLTRGSLQFDSHVPPALHERHPCIMPDYLLVIRLYMINIYNYSDDVTPYTDLHCDYNNNHDIPANIYRTPDRALLDPGNTRDSTAATQQPASMSPLQQMARTWVLFSLT